MSGTLVTESSSVSNAKKIDHGLPLRQNNVNGVYKTFTIVLNTQQVDIFFVRLASVPVI
jgi:hypothetical protein